jgi:hypothetical protein
MGNTISLNKDKQIGEIVLEGDQTDETIQDLIKGVFQLNTQLSQMYGVVRTLADVSRMGKADLGAQMSATKGIGIASFDRLAIVGASPANRKIIEVVVALAGKAHQIRFFDSRQQAEQWMTASA